MKVVDEALMAEFRRGRCEYRGAGVKHGGGMTCHHVHTRATGRLDVRINLIGLCAECHARHHGGGHPRTKAILNIVAQREGVTVDVLKSTIFALRRLDTRTVGDQERAVALLQIARGRAHHQDRRRGGQLPGGGVGPAPDVRPSRVSPDQEGWVPL